MLGCAVAGMGISLIPRSVLSTIPDRALLSLHELPAGRDRAETVMFWRRGANSPKVTALLEVIAGTAA